MSENQYDDLFEDDTEATEVQEQENGPKALRDALKKQSKELKELREFKAAQEQTARESEVKQALSAAGLPAEAAKFATGADDINVWIQENRGLFGVAGETATTDESAQTGAPSLTPEQIAELQSTRMVTPGQFQPGSREALAAKLDAPKSKSEFYDTLKSLNMYTTGG